MKAIRGKNGRGDDTMDGSSIEKKEEDRLFAFSWKQGRWVSDMDGGKGWMDGWSGSGSLTWNNVRPEAGFNGM